MSDFTPPTNLRQTARWFAARGWIIGDGSAPPETPVGMFKVIVDPAVLVQTAKLIKLRLEEAGVPMVPVSQDYDGEGVFINAAHDPVDNHTEIMIVGLCDDNFSPGLPS